MLATRAQLRDYQAVATDAVIAALDRRPILVAPTGSGKTVMGTALIERLNAPTLWLAHRSELIQQAADRLQSHGLYVGIIKAGIKPDRFAPIQVASVQTLSRRQSKEEWPDSHLVVIDECHHATAESYANIIKYYSHSPLVGLTATPFRMDGSGLGDIFGEIVVAATTAELCDSGVLHRPRVWCGKAPDLKGVKITAGDYNKSQVAVKVNDSELTGDIVAEWMKRAVGLRTVCFAWNVEHSQAICAAFKSAGVAAEHLDGGTKDRDGILKRLASGETQIVSNCMVLTEGWDLPSLGCAIIARPTASLNLHLQMIGRVMRACDGKAGATVLDHAGNHHVHGLVTRPIAFTLEAKNTNASEPLGLRRCNQCGMYFETSVFACPDCGWGPSRTEAGERSMPVKAEGQLEEYVDDYEHRSGAWAAFEAERNRAGFSQQWSENRFMEKFGIKPVIVDGILADGRDDSTANKSKVYDSLITQARVRGYSSGWAAHRYRELFGVWPPGVGSSDVRRSEMQHKYRRMVGV